MPNNIDEAITDSVTQVNTKVLGDTPATAMGNLMMTDDANDNKITNIIDKSLAQEGAFDIQDAANNMRDLNTLLSTASGAALAKFLESGDTKYLQALEDLNNQAKKSREEFIDLYKNVTESQGNSN